MAERLFVGIPLSTATSERLTRELVRSFPRGLPGRPVPPANRHITLRFLGDVEGPVAARLRGELGAGGWGQPFQLRLDRLGAFPSPRRARVLWLGTDQGEGPVFDLAAAVERRVRTVGLHAESRPYSPHITLARLREPADLHRTQEGAAPALELTVAEIVLFRSELGGPSPRYHVVETFPL